MNLPALPAAAAKIHQSPSADVPPKSIFRSRTFFAQAIMGLAGACGTIWPEAGKTIAEHASAILMVASLVGVILRKVTHGRVVFWGTDSTG